MATPPKSDPIKFCETCGVQMERKRFNGRLEDRTRFLSRRNCSQTCGNSKPVVQADTHRWRARKIQTAKTCEECGTSTRLHVDHVDKDVTNNDPTNLRTLCASCHLKLHWAEDRAERMASISANTRQPSSDGSRYLAGRLPLQLSPRAKVPPSV